MDTVVGTSGNDTFNATHLTLNTSDSLSGGAGADTLKIVDSGSAALTTPTVTSTGIETIKIQNINGLVAVAAVSEKATFAFQALAAGQTVGIAGITFTAGSSGATAVQVKAAFVDATIVATTDTATVTGGVLTGATITASVASDVARANINTALANGGYSVANGASIVNSVVFTATGTAGPVVDLVATGTAVTGRSQVTTLVIGTTTSTTAVTFTANGQAITTAVPVATGATNYAAAIADSVNAYYGSNVAVATTGTVVITTPTVLNLAGFASANMAVTSYGLTTAYAAPAAPTVSIVQGVASVSNTSVGDTVAIGSFTDATSFVSDASTGDVTFTGNLTAAQSVTLNGNGASSVGGLIATFGATVVAPVVNISGGTNGGAVNVTAVGATTFTVNSTGAANKIGALNAGGAITSTTSTLAINADSNLTTTATNTVAKSIVVSGSAASVVLAGLVDATLAIGVDASGMTAGGLTMTLLSNVATLKGGAGADVITTAALTTTTAGAIDAGAGAADVLVVADAAHVNTAAKAAVFTNFEVLRNSGATDLDVSLLTGITSVQLGSVDAGATKLTAAQATNIQVLATNTTNTIALTTATGLTDVLGLTLQNLTAAAAATAIDVTALTVTGFETLNVVSSSGVKSGGSGVGNDLALAAAGDVTAINVSGAYDLTLLATGLTKATTVTSTQSGTAALYVSGDFAVGSSVTGSAGADVFVLGAVGTAYNGGAGNDTFNATQAQLNTGAVYSAVNGGDGVDTLNLTGNGEITITDNVLSKVTGFEKIVIATTGANAQSIVTGGFFDAAFKTAGVDLTTTSTTGAITIDMTSFTGAATLSATTASTTTTGVVNIQTGSGADKVTVVTTASSVTNVISTFDGNDTIVGGLGAETITGGKGADTMTGGGGSDTFAFAAGDTGTPTTTNFDIITDYSKSGAGTVDKISATNLVMGTQVGIAGSAVGTVSAAGLVTFNAADTTFAQHLVAAEAALHSVAGTPTVGATVTWQEGLNTYVYISDAVAGVGANDVLIQLTGVTAGALTVSSNAITSMA